MTTSGAGPASETTSIKVCGEFSIRRHHNRSPPSSRHTTTDRRRCRSIPTYAVIRGLLPLGENSNPDDDRVTDERLCGIEGGSLAGG
jgi:hypothetical protein